MKHKYILEKGMCISLKWMQKRKENENHVEEVLNRWQTCLW